MKIGIPKELKNNESRVGMTPAGVYELTAHGHEVFVQQSAGEKSGFPDESYRKAGAKVLPTIEEVYAIADMIVKVKEPVAAEYPLIRQGQVVFTYFHFACERELTEAMLRSGSATGFGPPRTSTTTSAVRAGSSPVPVCQGVGWGAGRVMTGPSIRGLQMS